MSIPFYDDIYRFPGGYPHHHHHKHKHGLQPSYVKETNKSVDIVDKFGNLRYVVELKSNVYPEGRGYWIVVSQMVKDNGLSAFLQVPDDPPGYSIDYDSIMHDFDGCVMKYKSLVDAEMRDFRDIEVYKDKIGYEVQDLSCCATCQWCMKTFADKPIHYPCHHRRYLSNHDVIAVKMQCCNPQNEQLFNYAQQYSQMPYPHHEYRGWQKLPWQKPSDVDLGKQAWNPNMFPNIIFPTVDPFGKCENYLSGDCEWNRHHGQYPFGPFANKCDIAYEFDLSKHYENGDLVYFNGNLYECISEDGHIGGWNNDDFKQTTIDEVMQKMKS